MTYVPIIPVFYLSTAGEYRPLAYPRKCIFIRRMRNTTRDDYMLVSISPPLKGVYLGGNAGDLDKLLLSTRHHGDHMFPPSKWPTAVYVIRATNPTIYDQDDFVSKDIDHISLGKIHNTLNNALVDYLRYGYSGE